MYKGFKRRSTKEDFFVKGSSRIVEPPRVEYKGFKYKYKIKGDIVRVWLCRTNRNNKFLDHKSIWFNENSGIIINKKCNIMSKYINGPIARSVLQRKLLTLFKVTL